MSAHRFFFVLITLIALLSIGGVASAADVVNVAPLAQVGTRDNPAPMGTTLSGRAEEVTVEKLEVKDGIVVLTAKIKNLRVVQPFSASSSRFVVGGLHIGAEILIAPGDTQEVTIKFLDLTAEDINGSVTIGFEFGDTTGYWWFPGL